jgi:hypothetical protein
MNSAPHLLILKRVGKVLLIVGLLDMAVMTYCIANSISYSSSFNIFSVAGGVFLLRGSLRAASIIRWFGIFLVATFVSALLASPLLQPFSLTLTKIRLNPLVAAQFVLVFASVVALLWWVTRELGSQTVLLAQAAAGRKLTSVRLAIVAGIFLVIVLIISVMLTQRTDFAAKAISIAKEQLGSGYEYYVSSFHYLSSDGKSSVSGQVTAWTTTEIKMVPFQWRD